MLFPTVLSQGASESSALPCSTFGEVGIIPHIQISYMRKKIWPLPRKTILHRELNTVRAKPLVGSTKKDCLTWPPGSQREQLSHTKEWPGHFFLCLRQT